MEKKQTAVEWLLNNLLMNGLLRLTKEQHTLYQEFKEQAKQMEKEQIIHSFGVGCHYKSTSLIGYHLMAEQYYNETYGKQTDRS